MGFKGQFFAIGALAVSAAALLQLGGCTTTTVTNPFEGLIPDGGISLGDGGKKGDGSTGTSSGTGVCADFCNKAAGANCSKQSSCESDCKTQQTQTPAACQSALDDMLKCATTTGTFSGCSSAGKPKLTGCDNQSLAYLQCLQGSSSGDGGTQQDSGTNPGNCGGITMNTTSCNNCFKQSCCAQGATCGANAECTAIISCFGGCNPNDNTCFDNCVQAHPTGENDLNAIDSCLSSSCNSACQ